jgi:hypothetical protein
MLEAGLLTDADNMPKVNFGLYGAVEKLGQEY